MEEFASNLELIEYLENKIDALTTKEFYYINQVEKLEELIDATQKKKNFLLGKLSMLLDLQDMGMEITSDLEHVAIKEIQIGN
jgi:hypothetical protein